LDALTVVGQIGCLLALLVVVRRRLFRAFAEGLRGIARPAVLQSNEGGRDALALVLAALVSTGTQLALRTFGSVHNDVPTVAGVGLLLSAASLLSVSLAPSPRELSVGALGAVVVGLAHGLAMVPGMSQVGAAFVVLRWLGVGGWRAAETALMVSVPVMALEAGRAFFNPPAMAHLDAARIVLALLLAFVSASLAASWWRALCERGRTAWLGLWLVPLSLALLAYGRALPNPATYGSMPAQSASR
jgi:undecaprenyl-diphosphatase